MLFFVFANPKKLQEYLEQFTRHKVENTTELGKVNENRLTLPWLHIQTPKLKDGGSPHSSLSTRRSLSTTCPTSVDIRQNVQAAVVLMHQPLDLHRAGDVGILLTIALADHLLVVLRASDCKTILC